MLDMNPTAFDLRFRILGFPVRVHPLFWIVMALLGDFAINDPVLGPAGILVWVACGFVSILVHELGHALASRAYGSPSQIILVAFGGVAISPYPVQAGWQRLSVALAGPMAGFALLGLVVASEVAFDWAQIHPALKRAADYLTYINLFWNLFNLLPIWPLDGGKISREIFYLGGSRQPDTMTYTLSLIVAGALAAYGIAGYMQIAPPWLNDLMPFRPSMLMTMWFALFAYESYQLLQQSKRSSGW